MSLNPAGEPAGIAASMPACSSSPAAKQASFLFVWAIWGLMLTGALFFVWKYGLSLPYCDDWVVFPALTGHQSIPAFLWEQHNAHRCLLGKAVLLSLYKLSGFDLRAGIVFLVFGWAGLALAMIVVARAERGWTSFTDAFFPLALLHWGHAMNLIWNWQVMYVAQLILVSALLVIMVRNHSRTKAGTTIAAGVCLALLPLTGAVGLLYVPALALWLSFVGLLYYRSPGRSNTRNSILILGLVVVTILLAAGSLIGYQDPSAEWDPPHLGVRAALKTSVEFLSLSLGPPTVDLWPWSGWGVLGMLSLTTAALVLIWFTRPGERFRALGLLLFMGGLLTLALGLGWGRARGSDSNGFTLHYTPLAVPLLCWLYFVWGLVNEAIARFVQTGLFMLACVLLPLNMQKGIEIGRELKRNIEILERDLQAGMPSFIIAERHADYQLGPGYGLPWPLDQRQAARQSMIECLQMLHDAGVKPFSQMRDMPAFQKISMSLAPTALHQMKHEAGINYGLGNDSYVSFAQKEGQFVYAIRLRYSYGTTASGQSPRILVKTNKRNDFINLELGPPSYQEENAAEERSETCLVWVNDTISELRIHPDVKPCIFKISEIVFLVPQTQQQAAVDP
jgi:hypothetical protein